MQRERENKTIKEGHPQSKTRRLSGNDGSYLSSVSPPQAVAGLGWGNGDYRRGAGDTVTPGLAQEGP